MGQTVTRFDLVGFYKSAGVVQMWMEIQNLKKMCGKFGLECLIKKSNKNWMYMELDITIGCGIKIHT